MRRLSLCLHALVARWGLRSLVTYGVLLALTLGSCQSAPMPKPAIRSCPVLVDELDLSNRVATLNLLSEAFVLRCDAVVVTYGLQAKAQFRHKAFSLTREASNLFVPDGTFIEYVLESYERGYLSILLASSYYRLHAYDAIRVELRDLDHELFAPIYNYGDDPVNLLLSAVFWEQLGEWEEARVDWLRLQDFHGLSPNEDAVLQAYARDQIRRIDEEGSPVAPQPPWAIYRVGRFPDLTWDLHFTDNTNGYFSISPTRSFMKTCSSSTGLRLSTESWFEKLAMRHSHAYHPVLNVQTWIRLPMGLIYSLVPVAAGAGLMVGGCWIDVMGGEHTKGSLCEVSLRQGLALIRHAATVLEGSLRPDLRHWENVPAAIVVTRAGHPTLEACLVGPDGRAVNKVHQLL